MPVSVVIRLVLDWGGFALVLVGAGIATWSSFWMGAFVSLIGLIFMAAGVIRIVRSDG
jgi:hypothetical protein